MRVAADVCFRAVSWSLLIRPLMNSRTSVLRCAVDTAGTISAAAASVMLPNPTISNAGAVVASEHWQYCGAQCLKDPVVKVVQACKRWCTVHAPYTTNIPYHFTPLAIVMHCHASEVRGRLEFSYTGSTWFSIYSESKRRCHRYLVALMHLLWQYGYHPTATLPPKTLK